MLVKMKKHYDSTIERYREKCRRVSLVEMIYYRYKLLSHIKYGSIEAKHRSRVRNSLTLLAQFRGKQADFEAVKLVTKFLAAK